MPRREQSTIQRAEFDAKHGGYLSFGHALFQQRRNSSIRLVGYLWRLHAQSSVRHHHVIPSRFHEPPRQAILTHMARKQNTGNCGCSGTWLLRQSHAPSGAGRMPNI
jgi:hypothetical protein